MNCVVFSILLVTMLHPGNTGVREVAVTSGTTILWSADCLSESGLKDMVQKLSSGISETEINNDKKLLLGEASQSPICRQRVIDTLLSGMRTRPTEQAGFLFWRYGADILGDLKAVEATDHLISNLDVSDGLSPSMSHYPAAGALIKMGSLAIPKLADFLEQSSDPYLRRKAVFCIAQIGGRQAARALRKASHFESDPCTSRFINTSIRAFRNRAFPNQVTSKNRAEWYSAFLCHQ